MIDSASPARICGSVSIRCAMARRSVPAVPVPELVAEVKFFGRYRTGWIRDGVLLSVGWGLKHEQRRRQVDDARRRVCCRRADALNHLILTAS